MADSGSDVEAVASAYGEALTRKPEAAVRRRHRLPPRPPAPGDVVVVATGCEETLARGFLAAVGLGNLDVVGVDRRLVAAPGGPREGRVQGGDADRARAIPPLSAAYSDSPSDLPLFAGTPRPVLVNADEPAAQQMARTLGRRPETRTWR